MKRILKVTVALFVLALAVLQNLSPLKVNAADELANGSYTINYDVLIDGESGGSWGSFFESPASLYVKDGLLNIHLKINNANGVIQKLQTEVGGAFEDAQIVSEDATSRTYQFPIDEANELKDVRMFMSYLQGGYHSIQLAFDENSIVVIELDQTEEPETEDPSIEEPNTEEPGTEDPNTEEPNTEEPETEDPSTEEPNTEEPGTEDPSTEEPGTEEPETENPSTEEPGTEDPGTDDQALVDGEYTISYQVLYDGQPAPANWSGFFQAPATLTIADGIPFISFHLGASQVIVNLQSERNGVFEDVEVVSENAAEQTKLVKFQIADVNQLTNLRMVMSYGRTHDVALEYDVDSIQPIGNENPDTEEPGGEKPDTEEPSTEEPGDNDPTQTDDVLADGEYPLPLSILGVDSDKESAFAKYFADNALLTVNDGEYSLQFTQVMGLDTLGSIEFEIAGETVALEEISRDEEALERVLSVDIGSIQETYTATIEAIGAPHLYPVRFVLDVSSLDIEVDDDGSGNGNGQTPPPATPGEDNGSGNNNNNNLPFDRNDNEEQPKDNQNNVTNVKTGDPLNYLQVGIYTALLLLSGFYLFRKYRLRGMGM